ncbi:hypothetical protein BB560_000337 [Smittium megazygosporum]|uniref:UDENN domain-containing protein n=1 Tax=Smittium megazygosporum TaxID=133381 RepID=A0A2T9ZKR0_9FUNG|nr:hypothetical protein BB560_000337 [Smittium megazygosporum]
MKKANSRTVFQPDISEEILQSSNNYQSRNSTYNPQHAHSKNQHLTRSSLTKKNLGLEISEIDLDPKSFYELLDISILKTRPKSALPLPSPLTPKTDCLNSKFSTKEVMFESQKKHSFSERIQTQTSFEEVSPINTHPEAEFSTEVAKKLRRWLLCTVVVNFDENSGPLISDVFPYTKFSSRELKSIKFLSIPDSTINDHCDIIYSYRFKTDSNPANLKDDSLFLNAYVFFRQRADPLQKRGGMHKSIVLITSLDYHGLFIKLVEDLGLLYFERGFFIIETAFHQVALWPEPVSRTQIELPFLNKVYKVEFSPKNSLQLIENSSFNVKEYSPSAHILSNMIPLGLILNFHSNLKDLWRCWEVMILGSSIIVFADSPARSFEVVNALVNLILPIEYCGDSRPYFTLQDPDHMYIVSPKHVPPNTVLGVTNPFFKYSLNHWPNKLVLKSATRIQKLGQHKSPALSQQRSSSAIFSSPNAMKSHKKSIDLLSKKDIFFESTIKSSTVSPNSNLIDHITNNFNSGSSPDWALNNTLQRYFFNLTEQFLAPLNKYFSTLVPVTSHKFIHVKNVNDYYYAYIYTSPPLLGRWRNDDFFSSMQKHGIPLDLVGKESNVLKSSSSNPRIFGNFFSSFTSKNSSSFSSQKNGFFEFEQDKLSPSPGQTNLQKLKQNVGTGKAQASLNSAWISFYRNFLNCGNFATWLSKKTFESELEIWKTYFNSISEYEMDDWIFDKRKLVCKIVNDEELKSIYENNENGDKKYSFSASNEEYLESNYKTDQVDIFFTCSTPSPSVSNYTNESTFETIKINTDDSHFYNNIDKEIHRTPMQPAKNCAKKNEKIVRISRQSADAYSNMPSISALRSSKDCPGKSSSMERYSEENQIAVLGSRGTLVGYITKSEKSYVNDTALKPGNVKNYRKNDLVDDFSKFALYTTNKTSTELNSLQTSDRKSYSFVPNFNDKEGCEITSYSPRTVSSDSQENNSLEWEKTNTFKSAFGVERECRRTLEELCDMANFLGFVLHIPHYFDKIKHKGTQKKAAEQGSYIFTDTQSVELVSPSESNLDSEAEQTSSLEYYNSERKSLKGIDPREKTKERRFYSSNSEAFASSMGILEPKFGLEFDIMQNKSYQKWIRSIPSLDCLEDKALRGIYNNFAKVVEMLPENLRTVYTSKISKGDFSWL